MVVTDLDADGASSVAAGIVKANGAGRAIATRLDVTDEGSVAAAFDVARLTYGGLDVLVSNAGIAHVTPLDELSLADWNRSLAVNATGHFLVAREAVRLFKQQGLGGAIVFVATKNVTAPGKTSAPTARRRPRRHSSPGSWRSRVANTAFASTW